MPIAQANTELSLRNYAKSSATAASLGVDPALAHAAVGMASSSVAAALLPVGVRSALLRNSLRLGLASLRPLRHAGNPLGDVRVMLLQRLVDQGGSLPLIFPKEDLDFEYQRGALLHKGDASTAMPENAATTTTRDKTTGDEGRPALYVAPTLRVGARTPHCWFILRSVKTGNRQQLPAPLCIALSSIDLPSAFAHIPQVLGLASDPSAPRDGGDACGSRNVHDVPSLTLLVPASGLCQWRKALDVLPPHWRDLFNLVAIRPRDASGHTSKFTHPMLQQRLQSPRHVDVVDIPVGSNHLNELGEMDIVHLRDFLSQRQDRNCVHPSPKKTDDVEHSSSSSRLGPSSNDGWGGSVVLLDDITGRWAALCHGWALRGETGNTGELAVVVRPDGHVAAIAPDSVILPTEAAKDLDDKAAFLFDVCDAMHFKHFSKD